MGYQIFQKQTTIDTSSFLNIIDTGSMLAPYLLSAQSSSMTVFGSNNLFLNVFNDSGLAIQRGQPVKIYGYSGSYLTVTLSTAVTRSLTDIDYNEFLGLAYVDIPYLSTGSVLVQGIISTLNTSNYGLAGTELYVSTSIGLLSKDKPEPPNDIIRIGFILVKDSVTGSIYVSPQSPNRLFELTGFSGSNFQQNDIISYDFIKKIWYNTNTISISGSIYGTASWSQNSVTASYVATASYALNSLSASYATSASQAITASYSISASWSDTSSYALNSLSSSYSISASQANTASYSISSSYAISASNVEPFYSNMILLMGG